MGYNKITLIIATLAGLAGCKPSAEPTIKTNAEFFEAYPAWQGEPIDKKIKTDIANIYTLDQEGYDNLAKALESENLSLNDYMPIGAPVAYVLTGADTINFPTLYQGLPWLCKNVFSGNS